MKKRIVSVILILSIAASSQAQVLIALLLGDKLNSGKLEFGLTVGGSFSTIRGMSDIRFNKGLNIGLYLNIKLNDHFYLHPAAIPKSPMGARDIGIYATGDDELDSVLTTSTVDRNLRYINVPVLVKYQTKSGFGLEAGPQVSLRIKSYDDFEIKEDDKDEIIYKHYLKKDMNPLEFGFVVGTYYKFQKGLGVTIDLRYNHGVTNIFKGADPAGRNSVIMLMAYIPVGSGHSKEKMRKEILEEMK